MDQHETDLEFEKTLDESKILLDDASRVADEDYEFTLEGILAECMEKRIIDVLDMLVHQCDAEIFAVYLS